MSFALASDPSKAWSYIYFENTKTFLIKILDLDFVHCFTLSEIASFILLKNPEDYFYYLFLVNSSMTSA